MRIGVQTATLNAQVTFASIAVAISALAGEPSNFLAPSPDYVSVFVFFGRFLRAGGQEGMEMQFWVVWEVFGNRRTDKN